MVHTSLEYAEYAALRRVNNTALRRVREKGARYAYDQDKPTDAMEDGIAIHCLALEPDAWDERYVAIDDDAIAAACVTTDGKKPKSPRATKQFEEAIDAIRLANPGKIVVTQKQFGIYQAAARQAAELLPQNYVSEITLTWDDERHPAGYKARLDAFNGQTIYDVKTTADISEPLLLPYRKGYHHQMAFYREGVRAELGVESRVVLIIVSSMAMGAVSVELPSEALDIGSKQIDKDIRSLYRYEQGLTTGFMGCEMPREVIAPVPNWLKHQGAVNV